VLSFELDDDFVESYAAREPFWGFTDAGGNSLGELAFIRTYSRRKEDGSKERWYEVCRRVVEGMYHEQKKWCVERRLPWNDAKAQRSAQEAYDRLWARKWAPPGRGLWMMGTEFVHLNGNSAGLQNCASISTGFMTQDDPSSPFTWLMEASMLGVGVGFDTLGAENALVIYEPREPAGAEVVFAVPDTREGWCQTVQLVLEAFLKPASLLPTFDYSQVRPAGAPIRTFGGAAAGPGPLIKLVQSLTDLFTGRAGETVSSRDIVDVANLIGKCVVSGNVRRSAEIAIGRADDKDYLSLKDWSLPENTERTGPDGWAWTSNNSVFAEVGMDYSEVLSRAAETGEPGLIWMDMTRAYGRTGDTPDHRDWRATGYNPCLTGETRILVADGRGAVLIGELAAAGDDVPVFTVDDQRNVVVRDMRAPRKTGEQVPVFKITLDDGSSFRATGNHRLVLKDGTEARVDSLAGGEALVAVNRVQRRLHEIWGSRTTATTSQFYWWLTSPKKTGVFKAEHRIVAEDIIGRRIEPSEVVHHKDRNALNNAPSNLRVILKVDHDELHRSDMLGDKNPMRREWTPEWWVRYRSNMSAAMSGEKNGRYTGHSNEEIRRIALVLTKRLDRIATGDELSDELRAAGAPALFSPWRQKHLNGGLLGLARWAACEAGYEQADADCDPRTVRYLYRMLAQGYDAQIVDEVVVFTKRCESCDAKFTTRQREVGFCSLSCSSSTTFVRGGARAAARGKKVSAAVDKRHEGTREKQVAVFKSVAQQLEREPLRYEWATACTTAGVSPEVGRKGSPYTSWSDLKAAAAGHNHRVVSVKPDGVADVYNGTVDDTHRYLIAAGAGVNENGGTYESYILSRQCGEQPLEHMEMCTLVNVYPNNCEDYADYMRTLKFAYMYGKTVTLISTPWPETNAVMQRNRRIGVSFNGAWQFAEQRGWTELDMWMDTGFKEVVRWDTIYSEWLGVRESIRHTTVKPDGTGSLLAGSTPGAHASPGGQYYLRRIRYGVDDPVVPLLREAGYVVEPAYGNAETTVVAEFPIAGPTGVRSEKEADIYEKAHLAVRMQEKWSDNAVSFTLAFNQETERDKLEHVVRMFEGRLKTISFLPMGNKTYPQMPYEEISSEQYESYIGKLKTLDWAALYDGTRTQEAEGEKYCTTDVCEVKLT